MRIKRVVPRRRSLLCAATGGSLLMLAIAVAGCSGSSGSESAASGVANAGSAGVAAPVAAPPSAPAAAGNGSSSSGGSAGSRAADTAKFAPGGQRLVYTAQLTVRASGVPAAVARATSIVTAAGGYVSDENSSAGQGRPSQASATVTFKIPVAAYQPTLAALSGSNLGTQLSLSRQAQDVTQQVADTNSRVTSDEAAITQLRELLKRAGSVAELLSVQNQIDQQESDLESMIAQQSALNHQTTYATVTLSLVGPKAVVKPAPGTAPPGLAGGASRGWHAFLLTIEWLLTALGAAAPFLVVIAVVGWLAWWSRRRVTRAR
jgi:hypothetical protein